MADIPYLRQTSASHSGEHGTWRRVDGGRKYLRNVNTLQDTTRWLKLYPCSQFKYVPQKRAKITLLTYFQPAEIQLNAQDNNTKSS
jgi:hypothetical protein